MALAISEKLMGGVCRSLLARAAAAGLAGEIYHWRETETRASLLLRIPD
jgi:hypothetical protein